MMFEFMQEQSRRKGLSTKLQHDMDGLVLIDEPEDRGMIVAEWFFSFFVTFVREIVTIDEFFCRTYCYFFHRLERHGWQARRIIAEEWKEELESLLQCSVLHMKKHHVEGSPQRDDVLDQRLRIVSELVEPESRRDVVRQEYEKRRRLSMQEFEFGLLANRNMALWSSALDATGCASLSVEASLSLNVRETDRRKEIEMFFLDSRRVMKRAFSLEHTHKMEAARSRMVLKTLRNAKKM